MSDILDGIVRLSVGHFIAENIDNDEKDTAYFNRYAVWAVVYFQDGYFPVPYFGYFRAQESYYSDCNVKYGKIGDANENGEQQFGKIAGQRIPHILCRRTRISCAQSATLNHFYEFNSIFFETKKTMNMESFNLQSIVLVHKKSSDLQIKIFKHKLRK
jgi:hypothetical protein